MPTPQFGLDRLALVLFFLVSGGPYGLEDVVGECGPRLALVLIVLTPLVWALPAALVVAELGAALPQEGGFYWWVRRALGPWWGFQEGWWSWVYSFIDMAIYPVLFAHYLSSLLAAHFGVTWLAPQSPAFHFVSLIFVWSLVALNLRGAHSVGTAAVAFGVVVLAPFGIMWLYGALRWVSDSTGALTTELSAAESNVAGSLMVGLYAAMWNYLGWDGLSTFAAETQSPRTNIPRALAVVLPVVMGVYLLTVLAGLSSDVPWSEWTAGAWPRIAAELGGPWLGIAVAFGGMVAAMGFFSSLLLSNSRLPLAMAAAGQLPAFIARRDPRTGLPRTAIVMCGVIYSCFTLLSFRELVVLDVLLYSGALVLEFVALVVLRVTEPELPRPFRIPGGSLGLLLVCVLPAGVLVVAMICALREAGAAQLWLAGVALASGPVAHAIFAQKKRTF